MAVRTGLPTWMAYKPQTLARPTYDVVARNYSHYRIPRPPVPEEGGSPPGQICWGTVGQMPTAEPAPTVDFNVKSEEWREINRESDVVRVENPEDPNEYVMEDRPKRVKFSRALTGGGSPGPNTSSETPRGIIEAGNPAAFRPDGGSALTTDTVTIEYGSHL